MFAQIGARVDEALYPWQVRWSVLRYRVGRRLGLIPPPTADEIARAEAWRRAMERLASSASMMRQFERVHEQQLSRALTDYEGRGTTVRFRKYGDLTLARESERRT